MLASKARVDERGRLQIPRAERERASIPTNSEVLVVPKSVGHLELILVGEVRLERFQKKVRGRLKDWKEEEHRADRELEKLGRRNLSEAKASKPVSGLELKEDPIFRLKPVKFREKVKSSEIDRFL